MKIMKYNPSAKRSTPIKASLDSSFDEFQAELRSEVYNALSKVAFKMHNKWGDYLDVHTAEESMDLAYDWFATHFWETSDFEED